MFKNTNTLYWHFKINFIACIFTFNWVFNIITSVNFVNGRSRLMTIHRSPITELNGAFPGRCD
ncbi:hypothetical protein BLOT_001029 [Blomia tropicalis]|nr:hypothetical protein BLOT_001029 [Blomia tropicalis]